MARPSARAAGPDLALPAAGATAGAYRIASVSVAVPMALRVSEANRRYPSADIVWRDDPCCGRRAQVQAIFETAIASAGVLIDGARPVAVHVEVLRFHALTQKTRHTTGGVHEIRFMLTVRDAESGEILDGPRKVRADMWASGGMRAIQEEQLGLTQKVMVGNHLSDVFLGELSRPAAG